jgi:hypothetical protein
MASRRELGARLKALRVAKCGRDARGYVRYDPLISRLGITRDAWANWERGKEITPEALLGLIVTMGVSPEWLRDGAGDMVTRASGSDD